MPRQLHDVLIVGAGPAGLSAALWLRDFGLGAVLLEQRVQPGGQLHRIFAPIPNYLTAFGWDGERFAGVALADARAASLNILVGEPVKRIVPRELRVDRGRERLRGRAILLATGLRRRTLGVPGEEALRGRGVSHSANRDRERFAERPVVVIGGGTAAVEDALLCAGVGCEVTLIHRSTRFRARNDFLERARANPKIRFVTNAKVLAIQGKDRVEGVRYRLGRSRKPEVAKADAAFIRIGWEPETDVVRGIVRRDKAGYIRVGTGGRTSAAGIYAAGDACSPGCPSIANAVGQGAAAAWAIARALGRVKG